jgi:hypothetical protein
MASNKTVKIKKAFYLGRKVYEADTTIQNCSDACLLALAKQGILAEFIEPAEAVATGNGGNA